MKRSLVLVLLLSGCATAAPRVESRAAGRTAPTSGATTGLEPLAVAESQAPRRAVDAFDLPRRVVLVPRDGGIEVRWDPASRAPVAADFTPHGKSRATLVATRASFVVRRGDEVVAEDRGAIASVDEPAGTFFPGVAPGKGLVVEARLELVELRVGHIAGLLCSTCIASGLESWLAEPRWSCTDDVPLD